MRGSRNDEGRKQERERRSGEDRGAEESGGERERELAERGDPCPHAVGPAACADAEPRPDHLHEREHACGRGGREAALAVEKQDDEAEDESPAPR